MNCGQCNAAFPVNHELATLPRGDRIAFDASKGRVWLVCGACWHWNLRGSEAAARALPELNARFKAGELRQFEAIEISRVSRRLDLIAVQPSTDLRQPPALPLDGAVRDDIAASLRRGEIDRGVRRRWVMMGLYGVVFMLIIGHRVGDLINKGESVLTPVAFAVAAWYLILYLTRRTHGATLSPASVFRVPARLPGGMASGHHFTSVQLLLSALTLALWMGPNASAMALLETLLLVSVWTIGLVGLFLPRIGEVSGGVVKLRSRGLALLMLLGSAAAGWWLELVPSDSILSLLVASGVLTGLGAVVLYGVKRKVRTIHSYHDAAGVLHQSGPVPLRIGWNSKTQELEVIGLPHAEVVKGAEARKVVRTSLQFGMAAQPVTMEQTRTAAELVRSLGGLRGVVLALERFHPDNNGRIYPSLAPESYRLALDLALAGHDRTPSGIYALELAAESASALADEAERLDTAIQKESPLSSLNSEGE